MDEKLIVSSKDAKTINKALQFWAQSCQLLNENEHSALANSIAVTTGTGWSWMIRYLFWGAIICFFIAVGTMLTDRWFWRMLQRIFGQNIPYSVLSLFMTVVAIVLYFVSGDKRFEPFVRESILFGSAIALEGSLVFLSKSLGNDNYQASWCFVSFGVYFMIAVARESPVVWVMALFALLAWSLIVGYDDYTNSYRMLNPPTRMLILGLLMWSWSISGVRYLRVFSHTTQIMGAVIANMGFWGLSVFGSSARPFDSSKFETVLWSLIWIMCDILLACWGVRFNNTSLRAMAIAFGTLNLFTKYCEHFWTRMHQSVFFSILGTMLWLVGWQFNRMFGFQS